MNLHQEHNFQSNEDLLRVAVVEMRNKETNESLFLAMGEDTSDAVGYGLTSEEAIQDLEDKLLDMSGAFEFDWDTEAATQVLLS